MNSLTSHLFFLYCNKSSLEDGLFRSDGHGGGLALKNYHSRY